MINERVEVMQYLKGENLHRDIEYRICLLLAKYYYEQGFNTERGIREQLKLWAQENNFYLDVAMKPIAQKVISGRMKLLGEEPVYINEGDIKEIVDRFDTYYERIVALGVLSYAKIYGDKNGEFKISQVGLANWLGLDPRTISKHLQRMESESYIQKASINPVKSWYQTTVVVPLCQYRMLVPRINTGEYAIIDNDILSVYNSIFYGHDFDDEVWRDIPGFNNWYQISNYNRVRVCDRVMKGKEMPGKILRQSLSRKNNKYYVNLVNDNGKQTCRSVESLI